MIRDNKTLTYKTKPPLTSSSKEPEFCNVRGKQNNGQLMNSKGKNRPGGEKAEKTRQEHLSLKRNFSFHSSRYRTFSSTICGQFDDDDTRRKRIIEIFMRVRERKEEEERWFARPPRIRCGWWGENGE